MPSRPPEPPPFRTRRPAGYRLGALFGLCLLLLVPEAQAQRAVAVRAFEEGNRRYEQGNYRAALEAYEQATQTGYVSGALFFNMGSVYYRLDELGQAIRYYEKARTLMPDSEALRHNLEITRARTADELSQLPPPVWARLWQQFVLEVGVRSFFFAGLLLYFAAAVLIAYRIWTGRRNAWHRRALLLSLFLGLLLLSFAFAASLSRTLDRRAVVLAEAVAVHPEPNRSDEADLLRIHEGLLLDVLNTRGAWIHVRLPDGTVGWVDSSAVAEI